MMKPTVEKETLWVVEHVVGKTTFRNNFFSESDAISFVNRQDAETSYRIVKKEIVTTTTICYEDGV